MQASTETLTLPSLTTEIYRKGDGPTLVLIPGGGAAKSSWYPIIDRLAADNVGCVTYDNRGVGGASDIGDSVSIRDFAEDAAELIDALGDGPVHVCGVSMGGLIAMRLASEHPELVSTLGLHSTSARLDQRVHEVLAFRADLLDSGLGPDALRRFVALTAAGSDGAIPDLPEGVVDKQGFNRHNYQAQMQAALDHDMTLTELEKIDCPTLITVGNDDILNPPENSRALHRAIRNSVMVTIEGGGHGYYLVHPELVAALQGGWIRQHV
ncbi:MAG TPA: alpha/beta hydrolase [Solirubrobacteraceae bacterium]|nr:alpha/beta hydrolase [Solirubrobacteraceae bacterium]